ncbi:XAC2610-related protein [Pontibacter mangrovi]|uniref:VCBS repeat-containing protein n=1 Tax=Pontibacter mangrovi TaxID=2589816 RepID=A0A501W0C7_9BACT|nr:hypothetical protein [Pontibacter mangrovi]TPE40651.1 hypothetical protein FJM65_20145 [Pontibacter mangrovi]
MKTILTFVLIILTWNLGFSQAAKLDSTWAVGQHTYRLTLELDENSNKDLNTSMTLFRDDEPILKDSVWSSMLEIEFRDIDRDGFHDLLVYQGSGARANETYNLFLFREENNSFQKVAGFNEWPNINTTEVKGVIAACILTGVAEYRFFKLNDSGELIDLNISVIDSLLNGKAYKRGLRKAKKKVE